ncbi:MAG TPA: hypothetical protein VK550_34130 [Polyangiaceae bacterium]|nr:hypothetical protein [Polyangiaceae bacterium]
MKRVLSGVAKGGLAFAFAEIMACGGHGAGHVTEGSDAGSGAGGSAGSSAAFDGSVVDRALLDVGNQAETDANGGRGGGSISDGSSPSDAPVPIDGSTPVDAIMQDHTAGDVSTPDVSIPDVSIPDVSIPDVSIPDVSDGTSCAPEHCWTLPHVAPGAPVECWSGQCFIPPSSCQYRFGHCTSNPEDGCETNLSRPENCGSCTTRCSDQTVCLPQGEGHACLPPTCLPPIIDRCGNRCVDLKTNPENCGTCNRVCAFDNASAKCENAKCVVERCFDDLTADCNDDPGCETTLATRDNCLSCGNKACDAINTVLTCSVDSSCATPPCTPGYANCDATAGCEMAFASATAPCVPRYAGTTVEGTRSAGRVAAALAADGAFVMGGSFDTVMDFDPSAAMDVRTPTPGSTDAFITKFNADGTYGWTRTLASVAPDGGASSTIVEALAVQQDGSIVGVGSYQGAVDFDPGPLSDIHVTVDPSAREPFVIKMSATGALVWARTLVVSDSTSNFASALATDEVGAVYAGGSFQGTLDFDPGAGADVRTANGQSAFVVKLDSGGNYLFARTSAGLQCFDEVYAIASTSGGALWVGGAGNCGFDPSSGGGDAHRAILTGLNMASGSVRASYFFGKSSEVIQGVATAPDGSLYAVGSFYDVCDFDPGVDVVERKPLGLTPAGFILNLGADGAFRWVQTMPQASLDAVALLNDGSVLAVGSDWNEVYSGMPVVRWKADHTAAWSFVAGGAGTLSSVVAAGAAGFILAGINGASGDFDPGAGVDVVLGGVSFVSRYTF